VLIARGLGISLSKLFSDIEEKVTATAQTSERPGKVIKKI
jgi:hypothetical protein